MLDDKGYYQMSMFIEVLKKFMKYSREKKLDHFYSLFKDGQCVLDVGVSKESKRALPAQNYFLRNYRYNPSTYTGLGVQDLSDKEDLFPGKRFVQYLGGRFPFSDKEFDWVFSNAVIEHVGKYDEQLLFLNEMMRVANNVFFTTPNKYFFIESHTKVYFLHWNDKLFYRWRCKNRPWMQKKTLNLLSSKRLKKLLENSCASSFSIYKNRFFGMPITFTVICNE